MALLHSRFEHFNRQRHRDFEWYNPTDDLFDSLINPDSFSLPSGQAERKLSNDCLDFHAAHQASSSNSESLDVSTIPEPDSQTWHYQAVPYDTQCHSISQMNGQLSSYHANYSRGGSPGTHLRNVVSSIPTTPCSRKKDRQTADSPFSVKRRQCSVSPSKVDKQRSRSMRRFSPRKSSSGTALLVRRIHDAAAHNHFDLKNPSHCALASPPLSGRLPSGSFNYEMNDEDDDQAVRSPSAFQDDYEALMPPSSNQYSHFLHQRPPMTSPAHGHTLASPKSTAPVPTAATAEPQVHRLSSYPSSPLESLSQSFSPTPPATRPMDYAPWTPHGPFHLASGDKAEQDWYTGVHPSQVTCGAPLVNVGSGLGLGITCAEDLYDQHHRGRAISSGRSADVYFMPEPMPMSRIDVVMHASPTPRTPRSSQRPMSSEFSASALSPIVGSQNNERMSTGLSPLMYPLSPLMLDQHGHEVGVFDVPPPRAPIVPMYMASPQLQQTRQNPHHHHYRPGHQRSHTTGVPLSTIPSSILAEPGYPLQSFSTPPPPISSPSLPKRTTRNCTPANPSPSSHRRSKSAHYRKRSVPTTPSASTVPHKPNDFGTASAQTSSTAISDSASTNLGFVNFTPHDSRKILTGVAPSGSSKTKARREKEAADRRRKLSEAAKRVVLQAGGDLAALEREVFALGE